MSPAHRAGEVLFCERPKTGIPAEKETTLNRDLSRKETLYQLAAIIRKKDNYIKPGFIPEKKTL